MRASLALACLSLVACRGEPGALDVVDSTRGQSVVYGADNRRDVYEVDPNSVGLSAADAAVAFIDFNALSVGPDGDAVAIQAATLGQTYGLCDDERFVDQPSASWCSGTLIAEDLVLTAGHCVDQGSCGDFAVVFDYAYSTPAETFDISVVEDLFVCTEVVAHALDDELDYAIIRLDRAVIAHAPMPVANTLTPVVENSPLVLFGAPSGIPIKVDDGGRVVDDRAFALDYFTGTVDAFGGNSGSGVLDASGVVTGILVRGEEDYVFGPGGCFRVNVLDDDGSDGAEEIVYAANAVLEMCDDDPSHPICPFGGGVCQTCNQNVPCVDGFTCVSWAENPTATFCAKSCLGGCPDGHTCSVANICLPERAPGCYVGDVWDIDACGLAVAKITECGALACENAACVAVGSGDTCENAIALEPVTQVVSGSLTGAANDGGGTCGVSGPDRIYTFTVDETVTFGAVASGFDTLLHLRRVCDDPATEVACDDDSGPGTDARLDVVLSPGDYALYMDSWSGNVSNYTLSLTFGSTCTNTCDEEGESVCLGNGVRVCELTSTGCLAFSPPMPCTSGSCVGGECVPGCPPPCPLGDQRCASDAVLETCVQQGTCRVYVGEECGPDAICVDDQCLSECPEEPCTLGDRWCHADGSVIGCEILPDGCVGVLPLGECPEGMECVIDGCEGECTSECAIGERRCGTPVAPDLCIENLGGCGEWEPQGPCPSGRACVDGACDATCDDCTLGDARCLNDHAAQSCLALSPGCTAWSAPFYCFDGDVCTEGACVAAIDDAGVVDAGPSGPAPSPRPARVKVAPVSGCSHVARADDGGTPDAALAPLAALAALALRRRRAR